MTAKFGKLSIGCFIALILIDVGDTIYCGFWRAKLGWYLMPWTSLAYWFFIVSGIVLGYWSALRQETPKRYRYIGFLLHLVWLLLLVNFLMVLFFHTINSPAFSDWMNSSETSSVITN